MKKLKNSLWKLICLGFLIVFCIAIIDRFFSIVKITLLIIAILEFIQCYFSTPFFMMVKNFIFGKRRKLSEEDKPIIACHEVGHAIISRLVADRVIEEISIIPEHDFNGRMKDRIKSITCNQTKEELIKEIRISLGGIVAEEVIYGYYRDGGKRDLEHAKSVAIHFLDSGFGTELVYLDNSEKYAELRKILNEAKAQDLMFLSEHKQLLIKFQKLLTEKEKIKQSEIELFFQNNII